LRARPPADDGGQALHVPAQPSPRPVADLEEHAAPAGVPELPFAVSPAPQLQPVPAAPHPAPAEPAAAASALAAQPDARWAGAAAWGWLANLHARLLLH
jgi:hypothetical protein